MGRRSKSSNQCTILQCPRTGPPYSEVAPSYVVPMMFVTTWAVPYPVAQMSANQQQVTQLTNDDQNDKAELLAAKASLYDAREEAVDLKERLHLTLRSKDDLEDQLEWYKLNFDDARMRSPPTPRCGRSDKKPEQSEGVPSRDRPSSGIREAGNEGDTRGSL